MLGSRWTKKLKNFYEGDRIWGAQVRRGEMNDIPTEEKQQAWR